MRVVAPGKLLLTGAYAVLDGAPAVVLAIDRCAVADLSRRSAAPSAEVREAFGGDLPPHVDTRSLHDAGGRKTGLGSSAAGLVAALGARALAKGDDLRSPLVRSALFRLAREAHARVQHGGSGVDVAASVYGGVLRYAHAGTGDAPSLRRVELPTGLVWVTYDSGVSMRTSDMRARIDAFRARDGSSCHFDTLFRLASEASALLEAGDARSFVSAARLFGAALAALGHAADAPIVPPAFAELALAAASEDAAFLPSGAGGGDVAIWLGTAPPSEAFAARAAALSMSRLALAIDPDGVRSQLPHEMPSS